ncbi:nucleotidyltransferase [Kineococcus sp. T13]|nr:nucleotidyltransferase [Kineococcus vitellinus]
MAEAGTVLRTRVGSAVHGTAGEDGGDRDELGLCLEPAGSAAGPVLVRTPGGREVPFEQYELHTAWARPRGSAERSGAGDLDLVVYGARKWTRLALAGNPAALLPLWVPQVHVVVCTAAGEELRANASRFASLQAGRACLGQLRAQRDALVGVRGHRAAARARRSPAGYDVARAVHALRLGVQGLQLLRTGRLTLPVPAPDLEDLRSVRRGRWPLGAVLERVAGVEADLVAELRAGPLPPGADRAWVLDWLERSHRRAGAAG